MVYIILIGWQAYRGDKIHRKNSPTYILYRITVYGAHCTLYSVYCVVYNVLFVCALLLGLHQNIIQCVISTAVTYADAKTCVKKALLYFFLFL